MIEMFKNMWYNFYNTTVRGVDPAIRGLIIAIIFVVALVCFVLSIKKKDSLIIHNWFLFYVAVAITIIGVVYSCLW